MKEQVPPERFPPYQVEDPEMTRLSSSVDPLEDPDPEPEPESDSELALVAAGAADVAKVVATSGTEEGTITLSIALVLSSGSPLLMMGATTSVGSGI